MVSRSNGSCDGSDDLQTFSNARGHRETIRGGKSEIQSDETERVPLLIRHTLPGENGGTTESSSQHGEKWNNRRHMNTLMYWWGNI